MGYFDDIRFIAAKEVSACTARIDRRFNGTYSLELLFQGTMYHGVDKRPLAVVSGPLVLWHHPRHSYQYGALDEHGWHHHWVLMKGLRARRIVEEGLMPLSVSHRVLVRDACAFREMFLTLIGLVRRDDPRQQPQRVLLLERLLWHITASASPSAGSGIHEAQLSALADRIADMPCQNWDFVSEATGLHLSYSRFRILFRQQIGQAPYEYLLQCRMRYAARRLEDPTIQVQQVAQLCGYTDPAQFSKIFKNKLGVSPQQYRRAMSR